VDLCNSIIHRFFLNISFLVALKDLSKMGAESSSLQAVGLLNESLDTIEKRLFNIEDLILHHNQTVSIDNSIFISGVRVLVNPLVNIICGPVISSITENSLSVLLEIDQDCMISFSFFHKSYGLLTKDRFIRTETFQLLKYQPKLCIIKDLEPESTYLCYLGNIPQEKIYSTFLQFTTLSLEKQSNNLELFTIDSNDLIYHEDISKAFLSKYIHTNDGNPLISLTSSMIPPSSSASSSSSTSTGEINNRLLTSSLDTKHKTPSETTKAIVQTFSYSSIIPLFRLQIIELMQFSRDTTFDSSYLLEKLIIFEKEFKLFFQNLFNHSILQNELNRFSMQIFLNSSNNDISKLFIELLYSLALPKKPSLSPNKEKSAGKRKSSSVGPISSIANQSAISTGENTFLQNLYSSVVDERRIQSEIAYVEIENQLKELDHLFLSLIARLIR
jgi:hypothetical protein